MKMEFRKYEKIHRLGKEETDGVLLGKCYIQEKIDGANTSIWLDDKGVIQCGSRNRHLVEDDFNGFVTYARNHEGIQSCLESNPSARLYGEWLIKHTIQYNHTFYKKFYLFDVHFFGDYLPPQQVMAIAKKYGIDCVPMIGEYENPSFDKINEFVGKSQFGDRGEGVVIKNMDFVNKFGDLVFAKIVCSDFKEKNLLKFNENDKHSEF